MKVKFTKLAALLLAGAALFATGCTDYEVDIQKVDKKVDELISGKVASLEQQLATLQATVATLETKAAHDQDIQNLNNTISALETALTEDLNGAKERIAALERADEQFKQQIKDLQDTDLGHTQAIELINGELTTLKGRLATAEATLEELTKEGGIIDQIKGRIKAIEDELPTLRQNILDLQNGKLDKAEFDDYYKAAYEKYTKETIESIESAIEALTALTAGFPEDKTIKEYIDAADKALKDDYTEQFAAIIAKAFGTKEQMEAMKGNLLGRIEALEALTAGFPEGTTIKKYIDDQVKKLQGEIDEINGKLEKLGLRVSALEGDMAKVLESLKFTFNEETGKYELQAYIDKKDAETLAAAKAYTDEQITELKKYVDEKLLILSLGIKGLQSRIQSIVYVPDYDDLKITSNMSLLTVPGGDGAIYVDQPSKVTYKILPAAYAAAVADNYKDLLFFDVKSVNTRADDAADVEPAFEILAVEKDANIDENGLVTFTVLPVNVASAQFAATDLPVKFNAVFGWEDFTISIGPWSITLPLLGYDDELVYPVVDADDLEAYFGRTAFAASLRMCRPEDDVYAKMYGDDLKEEMFNEVASTYNVLFPAVTSSIEVLPDVYKPVENPDTGETELVKATPEYQYLPYTALRGADPCIGELADQDPKGYRIILDQAVPAVEITETVDGQEVKKIITITDALAQGYVVPEYKLAEKAEFTYRVSEKDFTELTEADKANFVETTATYAEIEMNKDAELVDRFAQVGHVARGTYEVAAEGSNLPPFDVFGDVEITKSLGAATVEAKIVWNWEDDAQTDHNNFYDNAEEPYTRDDFEVTIPDNDLEETLNVTLADFAGLSPTSLKISVTTVTVVDGVETEESRDLTAEEAAALITDVSITDDGKLTADFTGFEWDATYALEAVYELPQARITVTGTIVTVDRNREKVVIDVPAYTFKLGYFDEETGFGYIADEGWYKWESDALYDDIFKAFNENGVINVVEPDYDFAYDAAQEDFNVKELEGKLKAAKPAGTAQGYIDIRNKENTDVYAWTMKTVTTEVLSGELFNSGKRDENDPNLWIGNKLTRNITTFIGEEVEFTFQFNYRVPGYDFLHLRFYTFNKEKELAGFITKRDFDDNDGSVLWWTQVNPSYYTDGGENAADPQSRVSYRHALADYDVSYINLAELAFNVVDEDDNVLDEDEMAEAGVSAKFIYTDETLGEKELPEVDQIDPDFLLYQSLWVDNTVFYYRTNEKKFIPALGQLTFTLDDIEFPVATRFEFPKKAVNFDEVLDYSTFALVRWTPFQEPVATGYEMVLDENKVYRVPLFKGMELKDNRPNGVSYYVIKDGEWVVGNVTDFDPESSTPPTDGNGYIDGVRADQAYHIETSFDYSEVNLPEELKKLLTIEDVQGVPYVVFDYTSEVTFHGVVEIPVIVKLENPWQETLVFKYNFVIRGYGD